MPTKLIKLPEVVTLTLLSKSTIYKLVKMGSFPQPVKLSVRATGWRVSDVEAWLMSRQPNTGAGV